MKYLVTGGAGFIGSHVCEALLDRGEEVVCMDNFNDYYAESVKRRNIQGCMESDHFSLVEADIRNEGEVLEAMPSDTDRVIHLAARAGVRPSILQPFLYYDVNVTGTINLLKACVERGIANFVFGSSSSIYGVSKEIPFSEECKGKPISPYASSKIAGEYICMSFSENHALDIACLRFFTVYGPRNRPDMAIFKFTDLISRGEEIEMYGDGTTRRDYTYVADIVKGILAASDNNKGFESYNLGNNQTVELKELISAIEKAVGRKAKIKRKSMQPGDVPITYADISKARRKLGYNPDTSIEEGIPKVVKWYREVHGCT